ncbi:MAG: hypothetical protein ABI835_19730 [Chloroflexota bacterium]
MKNTGEKQVFEVNQVENVSGNMWEIRGRTYKDVRIGDTLYAHVTDNSKALPFEVVEIRVYGKNLREVSYGYASELVVKGDGGEILSRISHLYVS